MATIIYDFTVEFCDKYISPNRAENRTNGSNNTYSGSNRSYRMVDQMVQAARSNKQNIVEGSSEPVSKKSEIKLLGVARASFQELLEDYEDFLRQRGLRQWDKDSASAKEVRALAYRSDKSYETYKSYLASPEGAANAAICAINQASYLLDRQIKVLEEKFVKEGGWTEKMFKKRIAYRNNRSNFIGLIGIALIGLMNPC